MSAISQNSVKWGSPDLTSGFFSPKAVIVQTSRLCSQAIFKAQADQRTFSHQTTVQTHPHTNREAGFFTFKWYGVNKRTFFKLKLILETNLYRHPHMRDHEVTLTECSTQLTDIRNGKTMIWKYTMCNVQQLHSFKTKTKKTWERKIYICSQTCFFLKFRMMWSVKSYKQDTSRK